MIRAAKEIKDYTNVSRTVFFQGDCLYENLATPKILNTRHFRCQSNHLHEQSRPLAKDSRE